MQILVEGEPHIAAQRPSQELSVTSHEKFAMLDTRTSREIDSIDVAECLLAERYLEAWQILLVTPLPPFYTHLQDLHDS